MDQITIYDRASIDALPWPATADGEYARRVLAPLVREGPQRFIANVDAEMRVLQTGDVVLPLVIANEAAPSNSYVCSPTAHYISYALREIELELGDKPLLRATTTPLLHALRPLLRWSHFERVVYVNNWLLSTNLYPPLDPITLPLIHRALLHAFPDHAIVFRSINVDLNAALLDHLRRMGYRSIFSRQVYLLDPRATSYTRKKSYQKDRSLARRSSYRWIDRAALSISDLDRMHTLYADLYLHKYSWINPQFTTRFMRHVLNDQWLQPYAGQRDDRIDAVLGFVARHGVMTAPLIGYDRWLPSSVGLYRLISLKLVEEARERDLILNQSSGAAAFKRHRGSVPSIEYNMVYDAHVPPRSRLPWQILDVLTRRAIVPIMQRYEL